MKNKPASRIRIAAATALCLAAFGSAAMAQSQESGFKTLNPESLPPAHGYSHIVIAPVGQLVTISGQVAMNRAGDIVGENDFKAQCTQVFKNVRNALHAVGLTFRNVTRTDMFVTDLSHLSALRECRTHFLPAKNLPAANLAKVDSLFRPELMLEVSVQAVIPQHSKGAR